MPEPDVLTLREVAALLRVAEKTAYTLAQGGDLPGFKVGGQWRFRRADIESWIDAQTPGEVGFGSTEFIVLGPRPGVPRAWPYCLVRHEPFRAHAVANMNGSSGRQRVSASALRGFPLVVPPDSVLRRFGDITEAAFARITSNVRESCTLTALRDTLLPKLISGELRVPAAESAVAEAL